MKVDMLGFYPAFSHLVAPWGELGLFSKKQFLLHAYSSLTHTLFCLAGASLS